MALFVDGLVEIGCLTLSGEHLELSLSFWMRHLLSLLFCWHFIFYVVHFTLHRNVLVYYLLILDYLVVEFINVNFTNFETQSIVLLVFFRERLEFT